MTFSVEMVMTGFTLVPELTRSMVRLEMTKSTARTTTTRSQEEKATTSSMEAMVMIFSAVVPA